MKFLTLKSGPCRLYFALLILLACHSGQCLANDNGNDLVDYYDMITFYRSSQPGVIDEQVAMSSFPYFTGVSKIQSDSTNLMYHQLTDFISISLNKIRRQLEKFAGRLTGRRTFKTATKRTLPSIG